MAKQDVPPGWVYIGERKGHPQPINPFTGKRIPARSIFNPVTGAVVPRRQVEKLRIAKETGTSGSFEAKRKRNVLLGPPVQLPRKLKRRHALHGYRVHSMVEVVGVISSLPKGAEVYVRILARSKQVNYRGHRRNVLLWATLGTIFRAGDIMREYPALAAVASQFYDIRAYDIIVKQIVP